jgi:hypothetical protein
MLKMPQNMRNDAMSQAVLILAVLAWDADAPKRHEIFNVFGPNGLTPDGHIKSVSHWVVHYELSDDGARRQWMELVRRSVDINALRTLIEQKNARRLHDEGIRNREAKRVTKDAQQAYEQLNETPAGRTNRQR